MNVNTLKLKESQIPYCLAQIPTPAKQLFWHGAPIEDILNKPRIAVVGSRKATSYGRIVTEGLISELSQAGAVIVSGLAFGIDSIAHRSALRAGGITVAVLPSSLNEVYPASHRSLAQEILKTGGALVSEYPPGVRTFPVNFIARNRLVSGLAEALLITEAAAASGTMHTARFALEQGKTVMAVPGNVNNPLSEGCNNLIKAGATPVTSVTDILFVLKIKPQKNFIKKIEGTSLEKAVYKIIVNGITDQGEIANLANIDASRVSQTLTMLEINGYIKPIGAGNWTAI